MLVMQLLQAGDAAKLAGLTPYQLREWCGRRGVIRPDIEPRGPGRHALYSWQTVLVLRVLCALRQRYRIELSAWAEFPERLRQQLEGVSFVQLWGCVVRIFGPEHVELLPARAAAPAEDAIIVHLDSHLETLATGLTLPRAPAQMTLFPAVQHP